MWKIFVLVIAGLWSSVAVATEVRSLLLLSVMGDNMTVISHRPEAGSHLDQNKRYAMDLGINAVDDLVMSAAWSAVKASGALSESQVRAIRYRGEYDPSTWLAGSKFKPPENLVDAIRSTDATHMLVVAPHRAPAVLKLKRGSTGSGQLEGIGFYIDREARIGRSDTGEVGVGFLAPYAYLKVLLIDLQSWDIERQQVVSASNTVSVARNKDQFDPWEALDASQKISAITRIVRAEMNRVVPVLLKP